MAEKEKKTQAKEGNAGGVISKINKWRQKSADLDAKLAGDKYVALKKEEENLVKKQSVLSKKKGKTLEEATEEKNIEIKLKQLRAEMKKAWDRRVAAVRKAVQVRGVEAQVKEDSQKGNAAKVAIKGKTRTKKQVRTVKPKEEFHVPDEVQKKAEELGAQYVTLRDSKGNNIFVFEKDGKHAGVMTQKAGKDVSVLLENKSEEMKGLIHDAVVANRKPRTSDFGNVMDSMAAQYGKDMQAEVKSQLKAVPVSVISNDEKNMEIKSAELNLKPTVTLVPHIKRNGKPSKRNFDIQMMDSDGKLFILNKKMLKNAMKEQNRSSEAVDEAWNNYVKAAKEGNLQAETVASFFKGQTSLNAESASLNPKLKGAELGEAKLNVSPTAQIPTSVLLQEIKKQRS